jgi:hypothetical protein
VAAAINEGKRRRLRAQPKSIADLASVLFKLEGHAEMLAYEAETWRLSGLGPTAAKLPRIEESVQQAKTAAKAEGRAWTEEMEDMHRQEHAFILNAAEEDRQRVQELHQLLLDMSQSLDELETAYEAAKPLLSKSHRWTWVADRKAEIDRAFKESLTSALVRNPRGFRLDLARPGMDAALELGKWLCDADFDANPGGVGRGRQGGGRTRSPGVDTSKCEPPVNPTRPISIGAAAKSKWFGDIGKVALRNGIEGGHYRVEQRSPYKLVFDLNQVTTAAREDATPKAAKKRAKRKRADANRPKRAPKSDQK